jgi:Membrane-bound metallopeptidase
MEWRDKEEEDRRRRRYSFFAFKKTTRQEQQQQLRRQQEKQDDETWYIWKKFASLDIDDSKHKTATDRRWRQEGDDCEPTTSGDYSVKLLDAIGQIMAREILLQIPQDSRLISSFEMNNINADKSYNTTGKEGQGGGVRISYLSKHLYRTVFHAIKGVMVSWDLVEDPMTSTTDSADEENLDQDEDDAYRYSNGLISDDVDDANVHSRDVHKTRIYNGNDNATEETLTQDDVLWNIRLFLSCWECIVRYAQSVIQQDTTPTNRRHHAMTNVHVSETGCGLETFSAKGIMLHRHGEGPFSFASFCREAGSTEEERNTMIGNLLQNMTQGLALDILLSSLVQTNKAKVITRANGEDQDIVVLVPTAIAIYVNTCKEKEESMKFQLDKVDMAIFQMTCAMHNLELGVERFERQMEVAHQKSIEAKQKKNVPVALFHLKRRKMFQKEMETCMASLVNLETGLHTIHRTRDDAELVKTLELMNESLKAVRKEMSLEQVEELMQDLEENTRDLNDIHEELHGRIQENNGLFEHDQEEEEELERELNELLLADEENIDDIRKKDTDYCNEEAKDPKAIDSMSRKVELLVEEMHPQTEAGGEEEAVTTATTDKVPTAMAI